MGRQRPFHLATDKICRINETVYPDEDSNDYEELHDRRVNLKMTTWMKLYGSLLTPEYRAKMRDVNTQYAQTFFDKKKPVSDHGTFAGKFASSEPYHFFVTTVDEIRSTYQEPFSVSFHEIIDYTTGEIVDGLHINFMVEVEWIISEYMLAAQNVKMTILYSEIVDPLTENYIPFDVDLVMVQMDSGYNHSKVSILKYKDNQIRIIVSTANLYARDWQTRTQALWISPLLPPLPDSADPSDGESATGFKKDFTEYLHTYKAPEMFGWEALVHQTDCSAINVFFIASVPGYHEGSDVHRWGHSRLRSILSKHAELPDNAEQWPVVCQSSAVGSFGEQYESWLLPDIVNSMSMQKNDKVVFLPGFKYIYPTKDQHEESFDAKVGATCLMNNHDTYLNQLFIKEYSCHWRAEKIGRTRAMPHLKCYTRISPDETEIPWFVLTSANLSKAAWGKHLKGGKAQRLTNYEAGVVFIPRFMIDRPTFPIKESSSSQAPVFLLPYDLPLTPYQPDDEAFTIIQDAIIGRDETVLHETVNDVETANDVQTVNHSKPKNPFEMSEEELSKIQKADEKWQVDENEGDSDVYSEIEDDFKTPLDESDPGLLGKEEGGEVVPMETQEEAADTVEKSEEVTLESLDQLYYSSDVD